LQIANSREKPHSFFNFQLDILYQFSFLKRHSQKSLPASLFKGRRAFLNVFDKRFRFFPPVEWRQAYSTGGRKGDLTDFQWTKVLRYFQFAMMFGRFFKRLRGGFSGQCAVFRHDILLLLLTIPKCCKKNIEDITPTLPSPLRGGSCEKIGIRPLTLPSPRGGDGKPIEIKNKFPPP